jgi:hypothetical protein
VSFVLLVSLITAWTDTGSGTCQGIEQQLRTQVSARGELTAWNQGAVGSPHVACGTGRVAKHTLQVPLMTKETVGFQSCGQVVKVNMHAECTMCLVGANQDNGQLYCTRSVGGVDGSGPRCSLLCLCLLQMSGETLTLPLSKSTQVGDI